MGHRIAILKDGELVQYGTPDEILASPANDFVADFVGADRGLKRLLLRKLRRDRARAVDQRRAPTTLPTIDERHVPARRAVAHGHPPGVGARRCVGDGGERRGTVSMETLAHFADRDASDAGVEA